MHPTPLLEVENLHANAGKKPILQGISLQLASKEVCMLMGPNGAGKSTLAHVLMGHPGYEVTQGEVQLAGKSLLNYKPEERVGNGLFIAFQQPNAIPVKMVQFLKSTVSQVRKMQGATPLDAKDFLALVKEKMAWVGLPESLLYKKLYEGYSGGEKKRGELLQLLLLAPKVAILDEIDSGMDVEGLPIIGKVVTWLQLQGSSVMLITHNPELLKHVQVDRVYILKQGHITHQGAPTLIHNLTTSGYDDLPHQYAVAPKT